MNDTSSTNPTAVLSALLVAFTIELDNEFEHRMPHKTTRHGRTEGPGPRPWLVSMAMWVLCMRLVPEDGIAARDLAARSQLTPRSTASLVKRLAEWWGYLKVAPDRVVAPTKGGKMAQAVWDPLPEEIEQRWVDRFGPEVVDDLRAALTEVVAGLDIDPPDYLPIGEPRITEVKGDRRALLSQLSLTALLSKTLFALALDFDGHSDLSLEMYTEGAGGRLPICANVLRVIGDDGVTVADIPRLSGVDKMSIDNWVRILDKTSYIEMTTVARRRVAKLTDKGVRAREPYFRWAESLTDRWPGLERLSGCAAAIVGDGRPGSALWKGMEPYADGWRSQVPPRQALPHFPAVSHRGGYPDGS